MEPPPEPRPSNSDDIASRDATALVCQVPELFATILDKLPMSTSAQLDLTCKFYLVSRRSWALRRYLDLDPFIHQASKENQHQQQQQRQAAVQVWWERICRFCTTAVRSLKISSLDGDLPDQYKKMALQLLDCLAPKLHSLTCADLNIVMTLLNSKIDHRVLEELILWNKVVDPAPRRPRLATQDELERIITSLPNLRVFHLSCFQTDLLNLMATIAAKLNKLETLCVYVFEQRHRIILIPNPGRAPTQRGPRSVPAEMSMQSIEAISRAARANRATLKQLTIVSNNTTQCMLDLFRQEIPDQHRWNDWNVFSEWVESKFVVTPMRFLFSSVSTLPLFSYFYKQFGVDNELFMTYSDKLFQLYPNETVASIILYHLKRTTPPTTAVEHVSPQFVEWMLNKVIVFLRHIAAGPDRSITPLMSSTMSIMEIIISITERHEDCAARAQPLIEDSLMLIRKFQAKLTGTPMLGFLLMTDSSWLLPLREQKPKAFKRIMDNIYQRTEMHSFIPFLREALGLQPVFAASCGDNEISFELLRPFLEYFRKYPTRRYKLLAPPIKLRFWFDGDPAILCFYVSLFGDDESLLSIIFMKYQVSNKGFKWVKTALAHPDPSTGHPFLSPEETELAIFILWKTSIEQCNNMEQIKLAVKRLANIFPVAPARIRRWTEDLASEHILLDKSLSVQTVRDFVAKYVTLTGAQQP